MSENSYLRHFSAQVSQIVFYDLLPLPKMSENSYLHGFAQVSQIVFFAFLTVLHYNPMTW